MVEVDWVYWEKAVEYLAAAVADLANGRYNGCASRCYYTCFQTAIFAQARAQEFIDAKRRLAGSTV